MAYLENILNRFKEVYEKDKAKYIPRWVASWSYQDKKQTKYEGDLPQDFYQFNGAEDFRKWFHWQFSVDRPDYFKDPRLEQWQELSRAFDQRIFANHNLEFPDVNTYDAVVGRNNAQDYLLTHLYPVPDRYQIKKVLDFGAGFGRQANLWTQLNDELVMVSMDAIPKSYCLQHFYYSQAEYPLYEYAEDPDNFSLNLDQKGIYHLPTWRLDLLPDNSFDMVLCVQVLPELGGKLVRHMIENFYRILKPGGALYLRDNDEAWKPANKMNLNHYLPDHGFDLEFRAHVVNKEDILGMPRIWRKKDPKVMASRVRTQKQKLRDLAWEADALSQGRLRKLYKKFF
ncbi:MAG: methyltransferase domain-containing protein [Bacteroidota bacterium]